MSFAMLPPEVNSGRMHHGPGSASLAGAATAWDRLAVRLRAAAADCRAVASQLGRSSADRGATQTAGCARAYADWLAAAATHAEGAATRADAAVRAYQTAHAAVVPPAVIAANLRRRKSLRLANFLGHASAAIADTEADYERMWAQDAEAMYAYARASADASPLTPFVSPPSARRTSGGGSRGWRLTSAPAVLSAGRGVMATIPDALRALSRSPLASLDAALSPVTSPLSRLGSLSAPSGAAISHLNRLNKAAALRRLFPGGARGETTGPRVGRAAVIGVLSVPQAWSAAATPDPVYDGTRTGYSGVT
ncbi:PPE family protein [Mycobacterium sp. Marseille-P9652]|uniref:PPE family protein n=1 Tax=Mycobacterium sp. Marseille-P9652 TaxID=2654950 RepID=UPI0012E7EC44|nr:PPE family protein [Mycobacterium sp. Marseille-P9652]